jgi:hypothetical protein
MFLGVATLTRPLVLLRLAAGTAKCLLRQQEQEGLFLPGRFHHQLPRTDYSTGSFLVS